MTVKVFLFCFLIVSLFSVIQAQNSNTSVRVNELPEPVKSLANSTVRGRVFYADTSRPVKRASVMLMPDDAGRPGEASGLTDNQGYFQIKNVKAGAYYAIINAPGVVSPMAFADFSKLRAGGGRNSEREAFEEGFKEFEKIVVNGINDIDVQIPARRGGAISGRVMYDDGDAAIGVRVEILRKVDDKFMAVIPNFTAIFSMLTGGGGYQTDDRGAYRFAGLPPGEYVVKVTENVMHNDDGNQSAGFEASLVGGTSFLTVFYPDVFDTKNAQTVAVEYGQEVPEINLIIPSRNLFRISGKVISGKDKSPVKAAVSLKRVEDEKTFSIFSEMGRRQQTAQTDEQGVWTFKELPKGTYKIIIEPVNYREDYEDVYNANANVSPSSVIKKNEPPKPKFSKKIREIVIDDKDLADVTIELGFGSTVSGTVTVENLVNEMPNFVTILATNEEDELNASGNVGNYTYEGMPKPQKLNRDFKIESVSEGKTKFTVQTDNEEFYVKSMTVGSTDLLTGEYEIKEGENLQNVKIVLGKGLGILKGTVSGGDKEPVKNARIMLVPTDTVKRKNSSFYHWGRTDDEGKFEMKAAPGEYAVIFYTEDAAAKKGNAFYKWLDDEIRTAQTVKIEAGRSETLNITLKLPKP